MPFDESPRAVGNIDRLLRPRSIAIVGASASPGALGNNVLQFLKKMKFAGDIHLVNPKRSEIEGIACVATPDDLPKAIDAAILAIPRVAVLDTIKALAGRDCGAAVVFSAGFAEAGEEGLAAQAEIGRIAREAGMIVEGPNCLGCVNYVDGIPLTFVEGPTPALGKRKGVAVVSQSGAMAAILATTLVDRNVGVSYFVSTGNEAASGVEDYLEYMLDDPHSSVIAMIVEQFRNPARFIALAKRAKQLGKPIVVLHPGRSEAAAESAATHTGAMAGDYKVMKTHVERAGVILVETLEALGDVAEIAARSPALPSKGCAVLTESGAFKALTLDLCEDIGLSLPELSDHSAPALRAAMPDFVAVSNPVDMTAQALVDPDMYKRTMSALLEDDRFGTVVLAIIQTDNTTTDKKFPPIIKALKEIKHKKTLILTGIDEGAEVRAKYIRGVRAQKVPYFPTADRVMRAVKYLSDYSARDMTEAESAPLRATGLPKEGVVPEYAAKDILRPLGFSFPESKLAKSADDAVQIAEALGYPVVLKAQSPELSHKSDAGGVAVGLKTEQAVTDGWAKMVTSVAAYKQGLELDGILVEAMGERGIELIIGARNEPGWGPVILAGFGGVTAELYQDVRLLPPDLTKDAIIEELKQLKGAPLLTGFRGSKPADLDSVADLIGKLGRLMLGEPTIREIDLNPVVVYPEGQGVVALDALMLVSGKA